MTNYTVCLCKTKVSVDDVESVLNSNKKGNYWISLNIADLIGSFCEFEGDTEIFETYLDCSTALAMSDGVFEFVQAGKEIIFNASIICEEYDEEDFDISGKDPRVECAYIPGFYISPLHIEKLHRMVASVKQPQ